MSGGRGSWVVGAWDGYIDVGNDVVVAANKKDQLFARDGK